LRLAMAFIVFWPISESQWLPHHPVGPLCSSQFALANRACAFLPFTPVPPPSPPSPEVNTPPPPPPEESGNGTSRHRHPHHHRRRHHHHHSHDGKETSTEEDCCRWVKEIDDVCVCELLVRLPPFLTRPVHNYTVAVDDLCSVTYQCSSRL
ncbi:hypothetical protein M569_15243, partial [Genlisea aurea]